MLNSLRQPRAVVGLAVSVLFLYLGVRGVGWRELVRELGAADYRWLIPTVVVVIAGQLARAARWQVLFGDGPRPSARDAFAILSVGYMVSAVFPLRLGDPVRAWLIETRTPASGATGLATVLVERAIDFLTVAVLLALWLPLPATSLLQRTLGGAEWLDARLLTLGALSLVAAVYFGCLSLSAAAERLGTMTAQLLRRLGLTAQRAVRLARVVTAFFRGFGALRRLDRALAAALWSAAVWLLGALGTWLMMRSFGIVLPLAAAAFVLCATALFAVLPSSPGYVGVFHSAARLGLGVYTAAIGVSVPLAAVVSYTIVLHALTMLVIIILGLVGLLMLGLSGRDLGGRLHRIEITG